MKKLAMLSIRDFWKLICLRPVICYLLLTIITLFISTLLLPMFVSAQAGWIPDTQLVYMQGAAWYPKGACCGDTIHVVWWQAYVGHDEVFYKRSTDAGETWGADVLLSVEDDKTSVLPWVAMNQNYLHVVWQQQDVGICYRKSTDGGNSWLPIDTLPGGSGNPSVCAIGTNVYAVAYRTDGRIVFYKSTDSGNTWLPSQVLTFILSNQPRISSVCSNQDLLVLTCEDKPYTVEIYFIKSKDGGNTWIDSQFVSQNDSIGSQHPAMDADDSSNIHITWYDYKYSPYAWTGDIFYRASRDSGNAWESIDSLTVMHRAVTSDILAEGSNLHLVWEDDRNDFGNNFEIYYLMSTDLGQTWGFEVRLTNALYHSYCPSLACGGGYLHLFWQDRRDYGNSGSSAPLYYKRKDLAWGISEGSSIASSPKLKFNVYPNPFRDLLNLKFQIVNPKSQSSSPPLPSPLEGEDKGGWDYSHILLKIFDASGKEVFYGVTKKTSRGIKIVTRDLPCGVYFVAVRAGDGCVIRKAVKIK